MSKDFTFTTEYSLDKAFYAECYDQTSTPVKFPKAYLKAMLFLVFGGILLEFELLPNGHVGWFFVVLSIIEVLSVYFKRGWWLWRQTLGSNSSNKVIFTLDSSGIGYQNGKVTRNINWTEINLITQTDLGFILHIGKQRQYVSKSCLSDQAIAFILQQHEAETAT